MGNAEEIKIRDKELLESFLNNGNQEKKEDKSEEESSVKEITLETKVTNRIPNIPLPVLKKSPEEQKKTGFKKKITSTEYKDDIIRRTYKIRFKVNLRQLLLLNLFSTSSKNLLYLGENEIHADNDSSMDTDSDSDIDTDTDTDTDSDIDNDNDNDTDTDTDIDNDTDTDTDTDSNIDIDTDTDTDTGNDNDSDTETDTASSPLPWNRTDRRCVESLIPSLDQGGVIPGDGLVTVSLLLNMPHL